MQKEKDETSLKNDFLAAYHSILFSKTNSNEVDVERQRLAVKYMTAKKFESEEAAAILLNQGLKQYQSVIEKTGFLKKIQGPEKKDRLQWRTSFRDVQQALSLVKPLPCQKKSSDKVCGRRELVDRDVENLIKLPESNEESAIRKVPSAEQWMAPQTSKRFEQRRTSPICNDSIQNDSRIRKQNKGDFERMDENGDLRRRRQQRRDFDRMEEDEDPKMRRQQRPDFERMEKDEDPRISWQQKRDFGRMEKDENPRLRWQQRRDFGRMDKDEDSRKEEQDSKSGPFRTAREELQVQQQQKQTKKSLGGKAAVNSKFVCPFKRDKEREEVKKTESSSQEAEPEDERLRGIDEKLIELVRNEIMDSGAFVSWDDVAGLEHAKKIIKEIVVLPMLRPDIFTGLRRPPKGILLFGPPGTGKTLIGKCIASQSKSTFFSISASSLTSKWIGEGEKMVRALFAVARVHQPSVIFMDEIDSLLTQRSETEHESSRRIKTEFLVQLDGAATGEEDRILVIGATNRPQELDEAARRRFVKRLYVPLPEFEARRQIVVNLLAAERHDLTSRDIDNIANLSEHYSGADMTNLCKEASMGPIRSIPYELLENIRKEDVRCVTAEDFNEALSYVRPSVSQSDLGLYVNWDRTYGSGTASINSSKQ